MILWNAALVAVVTATLGLIYFGAPTWVQNVGVGMGFVCAAPLCFDALKKVVAVFRPKAVESKAE